MSFTPGSALYPALHLALLLKTKKHCCYKHFSPQSKHFQPQTLQQRVPRLCSDERRRPRGFIFDGLQHGDALVAPQEDLLDKMGGRKEKHPHQGCVVGSPKPVGMAQAPLPSLGLLSPPATTGRAPLAAAQLHSPTFVPSSFMLSLSRRGFH